MALINAGGGLTAEGFDWEASFPSPVRGQVTIPETLADPGEFSGEQLRWLRGSKILVRRRDSFIRFLSWLQLSTAPDF